VIIVVMRRSPSRPVEGSLQMNEPDVGAAYRGVRERLTELLNSEPDRWESPVPHCPAWSVRETVAHLVGVVDDAINGNMAGIATESWTAAQVAKRQDRSGEELLEEWTTYAPFMEARLTNLGLAISQALFDTATHEHDLRHALGRPGARESDAVAVAVHFICSRLSPRLTERGLLPVRLVIDGVERTEGELTLTASSFEILRAFGSRRSHDQVRAMDWSADPTPVMDALTPFGFPPHSIPE
jgi:uncharacterized protein (TIGR03083 family)